MKMMHSYTSEAFLHRHSWLAFNPNKLVHAKRKACLRSPKATLVVLNNSEHGLQLDTSSLGRDQEDDESVSSVLQADNIRPSSLEGLLEYRWRR